MLRVSQLRLHPLRALSLMAAALSAGILIMALVIGLSGTMALFTSDHLVAANIAAGRIFRDERVTPAFAVNDVSSGSAVDGSSVTAFANDSRYFLTRSWPPAFANGRYIDLEFNDPLPAGLSAQTVTLTVRLSSDTGVGSACVYLELRRVSTNGLLSTHGSPGSPLACTSGTLTSMVQIQPSSVDATDVANDLRVRLFADDSGGGAIRIDQATVAGSTPYASFTLYPILTSESFDGQVELIRWSLAGP